MAVDDVGIRLSVKFRVRPIRTVDKVHPHTVFVANDLHYLSALPTETFYLHLHACRRIPYNYPLLQPIRYH